MQDGADNDVDWYGASSKAKIILNVTENSGIANYEYSVGTEAGEKDIFNWFLGQDSIGFFDVSDLVEGTDYFANARVTDRVGFKSEVISTDGFRMDYGIPVAGTVSIKAPFQSDTNNIIFTWQGFSDALSGIGHYDYTIGTTAGAADVAPRTNTGSMDSTTATNLKLGNNNTCL